MNRLDVRGAVARAEDYREIGLVGPKAEAPPTEPPGANTCTSIIVAPGGSGSMVEQDGAGALPSGWCGAAAASAQSSAREIAHGKLQSGGPPRLLSVVHAHSAAAVVQSALLVGRHGRGLDEIARGPRGCRVVRCVALVAAAVLASWRKWACALWVSGLFGEQF